MIFKMKVIHWIEAVGIQLNEVDKKKYFLENAERLFFSEAPPAIEPVEIPDWVEKEFDKIRTLPLFSFNALNIPMDVYRPFLSDYIRKCRHNKELKFADYIVEQLRIRSKEL